MKICILTTSYPRYAGDYAGNFVHNLAKELVNQDVSVSIVAPHDISTKSYEIIDGVEIYRFQYWFTKKGQRVAYGGGIPYNLSHSLLAKIQLPIFMAFFFFKGLNFAKKCDIIHAQFLLSGFIGIPIKHFIRKPLITTVHGSDIRGLQSSRIVFFLLLQIDRIISAHPELTEKLSNFNLFNKITEIPNIINFGKYEKEKTKKSLEIINKEFNLKNEKIVTYVARFVEMKDPMTFIKSIPYVIEFRQDIRFFLVGDGPLINEIQTQVKRLKIDSYVILTGYRNDISRFLKRSDIFVATSKVENIWSMTIVEAITLGIPCVLTSVGYTEKIFTNLKNAYLVHPQDERNLAFAILELLQKENLRKKISINAKLLLEERGLINNNVIKKMIRLYEELTSNKKINT